MRYLIFKSQDGEGKERFTPIVFPDYIDVRAVQDIMRSQEADGTTSFTVYSGGDVLIDQIECRSALDKRGFPLDIACRVDSRLIKEHNRRIE